MIIIEIPSSRLVEVLDIVIHSIIDPLLSIETVGEQIQFLDDESRIASSDDGYRASRLLAHVANQNHPMNQYLWGSVTFSLNSKSHVDKNYVT